jgi:phage major head subunit gpT-like protein
MADNAILPRITSRFVRGELRLALQGAAQVLWLSRIGLMVDSASALENYAWLGQVPQMRQWVGGRQHRKLREFEYTLANTKFEATIDIPLDWVRRDKLGVVRGRINDLAARDAAHWRKLLTDAINNGSSSVCYDGQYYFDSDHAEGDSGTQSNLTTSDITTTTAPTAADMAAAITTVVQRMVSFKDDAGEYLNEDLSGLLLMVPVGFIGAAQAAIGLQTIVDGSASRSNLLPNWAGFTFEVVGNPRLTATDAFYAFRTDRPGAIVLQNEYGPLLTEKAEGSDYEHDYDAWQFGVMASRAAGYGFWQNAVKHTFTLKKGPDPWPRKPRPGRPSGFWSASMTSSGARLSARAILRPSCGGCWSTWTGSARWATSRRRRSRSARWWCRRPRWPLRQHRRDDLGRSRRLPGGERPGRGGHLHPAGRRPRRPAGDRLDRHRSAGSGRSAGAGRHDHARNPAFRPADRQEGRQLHPRGRRSYRPGGRVRWAGRLLAAAGPGRMNLQVSLDSQVLADIARTEEKSLARISSRAIRQSGARLRARLQVDTTTALGPKVANAWRFAAYPPVGDSARAAGLVYTRAPNIIDAFNRGAEIRPSHGQKYLAIPTANVRKQGGQKDNPRSFEEAGIKLRFVPARGGRPALLVSDEDFRSTARGVTFRNLSKRTGKRIGRAVFTVFFILVPMVRMRKLLDLDRRAREAETDLVSQWGQAAQALDYSAPAAPALDANRPA